ncbi:MAG: 3D domain-containing protein [Tissierellia bacterium]|nr:3D domain-containing protein [Tissierellia bacterium]
MKKAYKYLIFLLLVASLIVFSGFMSNDSVEKYDKIYDINENTILNTSMERYFDENIERKIFYKGKKYILPEDEEDIQKAIKESGIVLEENYNIFPSDGPNDFENLFITSFSEEKIKENSEIEFKSIRTDDPDLEKGKEVVAVEGVNGLIEKEYLLTKRDDVEVSKKLLSEKILNEAINEEIMVGTKEIKAIEENENITESSEYTDQNTDSASDQDFNYSYFIDMQATAYDASVADGVPYTASGTIARPGVIAVDPSVIPLGSRVYIESLDGWPSYGYAVAEDTGSAIVGNIIDLFYDSHQTALDFGRRSVRVYILN